MAGCCAHAHSGGWGMAGRGSREWRAVVQVRAAEDGGGAGCCANARSKGWLAAVQGHKDSFSGNMRIVGLTGGIASGKSTASKEFQALGIPIIDADRVAHAALKKGTLAWRRVVAAFGEGVLQENGEVDRARLGEMIFSDPAKRKNLNSAMSFSIAMGLYWELFKHWMKGTRVVIMDVPLLFETGLNKLTKPVIVVWVDPETQEERLMKRDKISKEQAVKKIASQLPLDLKRDQADLVIDNSNSLDAMKEQALEIYKEIMAPLTWKELVISRTGLLTLGVAVFAFWFFMR